MTDLHDKFVAGAGFSLKVFRAEIAFSRQLGPSCLHAYLSGSHSLARNLKPVRPALSFDDKFVAAKIGSNKNVPT